MKQLASLLVFLAAATNITLAQSLNTQLLDSLLNHFAYHNRAIGSVAISENGRVVYTKAFGQRDAKGESAVLADPATKYRIGSITKTFTAAMIMQLVDEGKLTLDTKLSTFFPRVRNADKITIAHLLQHRSGIHNFTDDDDHLKWYTKPQTQAQMVSRIEKLKSDFEPGTEAQYSNSNYVLLGYIIEKATGLSYANALQERITKPLGLTDTYYGTKTDPAKNEARSYTMKNSRWDVEKETDMSVPGGAGAMVSTPSDMTRFIYALFAGRVVSDASLKQMTELRDRFGFGLIQVPFFDERGFGHTGGIDAFISNLAFFPGDSVAIAASFNGADYNTNDILIGILSIYFNKPYEFPSLERVAMDEAELKRYEGEYASNDLPLKITIRRDGDRLTAQATGQPSFPLETVNATTFKFDQAGVVMEFDVPPSGKVTSFTLKQGLGVYAYTRTK